MTHTDLCRLVLLSYGKQTGAVAEVEYLHCGGGNIFAIPGTHNAPGKVDLIWDWINNLRAIPWYSRELKSWHPAGYLKMSRKVAKEFNDLIDPDLGPIMITGHSLGGAVTLITAALLVVMGWDIATVVTYGAPRVGQLDELDNVKDVTMYGGKYDLITMVPPGYSHTRELTETINTHGLPLYLAELERLEL